MMAYCNIFLLQNDIPGLMAAGRLKTLPIIIPIMIANTGAPITGYISPSHNPANEIAMHSSSPGKAFLISSVSLFNMILITPFRDYFSIPIIGKV
jgi:hypothetical protein